MACIKYSGRFLEPVAKTCLPISSNTTGRCSRFISNIDCNCFFALCKKNLIIIPMYSYFLMFLSTLLLYNYIKYECDVNNQFKNTKQKYTANSLSETPLAMATISCTITSTISFTWDGVQEAWIQNRPVSI